MLVGQAQKEFTVNEALARLDSLLHPAVQAEANDPPATPANGESWLVGSAPTGHWSGHENAIASWQAGNWIFVEAQAGMRVFDKSLGAERVFDGDWSIPSAIAAPDGGAIEDAEARAAITAILTALVEARILAVT